MLGLRPLQGPDVLRIDFIVPRLHLEDQELPRVLGLHLHPNLLLIQGLPALDNLGTRIPWMWHGLLLLLGSAIWRFPCGYPAFALCTRSAHAVAIRRSVVALQDTRDRTTSRDIFRRRGLMRRYL